MRVVMILPPPQSGSSTSKAPASRATTGAPRQPRQRAPTIRRSARPIALLVRQVLEAVHVVPLEVAVVVAAQLVGHVLHDHAPQRHPRLDQQVLGGERAV